MKRILTFAAALTLGIGGCATPRPDADQPPETKEDRVRRFEETFRPSDYDAPPPASAPAPVDSTRERVEEPPPLTPPPFTGDQVQGFRVQIASSASIDAANEKKALAESLFPTEWIYLQYDQPTYKIRAGNFLTRREAEKFRSLAADRGFPGAWIVPSRVLKNPSIPKRPPPVEKTLQSP